MNILYIVTKADGGGAQKYVLEIAKHFNGSIAAGTEDTDLYEKAAAIGITTYKLKYLKRNIHPIHDVLALFEIVSLIRKVNPDIVHLNSSKAGAIGSVAGKLCGKKVVFTAHGFFYFTRASLLLRIGYTLAEKCASLFRDRIIAVSEEDASLARAHHLLADDKIVTVHNGISKIPFLDKDSARSTLGLRPDAFIFGNIAQYYNRKGLDILIEAVSNMSPEDQSKIQIALIGEGPERDNLEKLIADKKMGGVIKLIGFVNNASYYLTAFDAFVLSSRREGFSYVILEAMQAGLPIIATDVGGTTEAVGDGAMVIPPENPKELTKALTTLLNSSSLGVKLKTLSTERAKLFTEDVMFEKTFNVYKSL